jgi:hypothetical protein
VDFEWDEKKAAANEKKHGIPFAIAAQVFLDERRIEWADDRNYGERRNITIGLVDGIEITVAYTVRRGALRLISARKATRNEREDYWSD